MTNVLVLLGSARAASVNRKLAQVAVDNAPAGVSVQIYPGLELLPHFSQDIEEAVLPHDGVARFKAAARAADALLLVTPAYNAAPSAVLKNAIDWSSRPYGEAPISGKPVAVIGAAFHPEAGPASIAIARATSVAAGGAVIEETLFASIGELLGGEPAKNPLIVDGVKSVLEALVAAVKA